MFFEEANEIAYVIKSAFVCNRLAEQNTPAHLLCNQMGHASSKVTEKYYLAVSKQGEDIIKGKLENI